MIKNLNIDEMLKNVIIDRINYLLSKNNVTKKEMLEYLQLKKILKRS